MGLKFNMGGKSRPKLLINIGALLDIPTSAIITGKKGESIINGGLGYVTGIVGAGNNYKSTILHYMMLSAADKIKETHDTSMSTYDTEVNISIDRLEDLSKNFNNLPDDLITSEDSIWGITDKSLSPANKWGMELNDYAENKIKDKSIHVNYTAFTDPYTKGDYISLLPTFVEIDSLTEFEGEVTMDMLDSDLDDKDTNTYAIKQGGFKTKFLSRIPKLTNNSNIFILLTAHIGKKINLASGPSTKFNQPTRELQYLKGADSLKGVSTKFTYLLNNGWFAHTASVLKNQKTKEAEYPTNSEQSIETELNTVKLTQLRSKSGPSGYTLELVVSQTKGVLPTLTEFHYIKSNNRYGIDGSNISYFLDIYPDVKLSRTTVRNKIDNDPLLRRAINITSELHQLGMFHPWIREQGLMCTPKELYEDIKKLGYDWNKLLDTRGYWVIDQYNKNIKPFLSTVDLLKMRKEQYVPYWYKKE